MKLRLCLALLVACALVVTVFACQREQKVYLGYVAGLRGLGSELGQAGFNGAVLAVENINHQGGIDGRQVELLVRDHLGDTDLAIEEVHELVEAGCVAFIGQMLSQKSVKVLPALQGSGIVMVSPTTATSELSEKDDQFLRIYPDERLFASRLARYASREQGLRHMVVVANSDNRSFSEPWIRNFSDFYIGAGGVSVERIWFSNGSGGTFAAAAVETLKGHPDGVVILANARDSGMLAQHIRRHDRDIALFTAEWSFAGDLLRYGGQAVDGLTMLQTFDPDSARQGYIRFSQQYQEMFKRAPGFAAVNSYDAVMLTAQALRQQKSGETLKQALLRQGEFQGLQVPMNMDRYGDIKRPLFMTRIVNGQVTRIVQP